MTEAVTFDRVSIVFGDRPEAALPLMDEGLDRSSIQARTGQVLGVHDCDMTVAEGEIVVLMGLSGSGKSTLLRAVNALNPVTRGTVRVSDGDRMVDVHGADAATLRRLRQHHIAMVFQQFGLLPWRSVAQNVGLGLELSGLARADRDARVARQLDLVGLADWGDRPVSALSGGMQQRVGLARAFATDAPILLMDEPFSALDPLIRTHLQDELLELQTQLARTIVFVSHDLDEAFKLGDRIAIMEGGRIVQCGTPQDIFTAPATDYVAEFVAHMNPLGVLRAQDVMRAAAPGTAADGVTVPPGAGMREVMAATRGPAGTVGVVADGRLMGQITADDILARLLDPRG
jgi:glycine betaine/proline transport system ATP-binding protein